ncbi:hypothetical protein ACHAXR_010869 [Thalassiosira sp. AJA248-18]
MAMLKKHGGTPKGGTLVLVALVAFVVGFSMGVMFQRVDITDHTLTANVAQNNKTIPIHRSGSCDVQPQIYNFMKELKCRSHHMNVPPVLNTSGHGKVVLDIGLDAGDEFFTALESGYSVYGFEANPLTIDNLRPKCESAKAYKCVYVDAANITEALPPIPNGGYLIGGGAGSHRSVMNMSIAGPGSSFVEVAPGVQTPAYKQVTIIPVSDVVKTDVFFFKLDVQGFELEVLKGAQGLFDNHVVKTLLMEVYPRGLGNAGVNFTEFLDFLWADLGMFCSSSNPGDKSFKMNHPNALPQFAQYLKGIAHSEGAKQWWGIFDDFYCFNMRKSWVTN